MKVIAKKSFIADLGQGTERVHVGQILNMPETGEVLYWLDMGMVDKVRARRKRAKVETAAVDPGEKAIKPRAQARRKK